MSLHAIKSGSSIVNPAILLKHVTDLASFVFIPNNGWDRGMGDSLYNKKILTDTNISYKRTNKRISC